MLPICHIYSPASFSSFLSSYFKDDKKTGNSCLVVGQWEIRSGKHGKWEHIHAQLEDEEMKEESRAVGVGKSKSRTKGSADAKPINDPERQQIREMPSIVVVMNIVGVVPPHFYDKMKFIPSDEMQIIGRIHNVKNWKPSLSGGVSHSQVSPLLHLQHSPLMGTDNKLTIEAITWKGQHYPTSSFRLILFEYDPVELQQWKIPRGYVLGIPKVVLTGLAMLQEEKLADRLNFIPALSRIPQDHQNLSACSEAPSLFLSLTSLPMIDMLIKRSAGLQQISHKVSIVTGILARTYPLFPVLNFLFLLALDSLIGYMLTSYLSQFPSMLGLLHTTVEQMLDRLNHLLNWLRGAPAGLKLNANLNSLYWRFFSYHIHLWANYIGILEPVFAVILNTVQYLGILGVSIQMSLLKDLLSLATFHVYCLYIYASRLYSLQTDAIKALCRVFLGKKYNPLRERIDSVQLTTSELFLSSFAFVILIFLLPTTMVYYAGFVCLRIPVIVLERCLQYAVVAYNKLPVVPWVLVFLESPRVADEIYLIPKENSTTSILSFRLGLQSTRMLFPSPDFGRSIKDIFSSVIGGTVIKK